MGIATISRGRETMSMDEKPIRRVKVSKQRQISIPKDFYDALNLLDEAIIEFNGKEIIIRPADYEVVDFSVDILKDLVSRGYTGNELITNFTAIKAEIPNALNRMKLEAMSKPVSTGSLDEYLDSLEDTDEDE